MSSDSGYAAALRELMTNDLVARGFIGTRAVARAFRNVPRHLFAPAVSIADAYRDRRIDMLRRSCITPPSISARVLEQLDVRPGQRVLEIGAGSGYNAALLSDLVGPAGVVVTVELNKLLVENARRYLTETGNTNVHVVHADGYFGWSCCAPYDRILLTCASDRISPSWELQLSSDGLLQLPLVLSGTIQKSVAFRRASERALTSASVIDCFFVPLWGENDVWSRSTIPLGPIPGLSVGSGDQHLDRGELYGRLLEKSSDLATGVVVTASEMRSGLNAWVATQHEGCITLLKISRVGRPLADTMGLYVHKKLAVIALKTDLHGGNGDLPTELLCRYYGDSHEIALVLRDLIRTWAAAECPSSKQLSVDVAPHGDCLPSSERTRVIKRGACTISFSWKSARPQVCLQTGV